MSGSCAIEMCLTVSPFLAGKINCHLIEMNRDSMKHGVNNFLHHELIVWAKARGYKNMLIGGGRTNAEDHPLLKFKKNFSNSTKDFFCWRAYF